MNPEEANLILLHPRLLAAIPVILLVGVGLYFWARRNRRVRLAKFTTEEETARMLTSPEERRRILRHALVLLGLCLLVVALARPMVGPKEGSAEREGMDVMLAIDVSKSMLAADMEPFRLAAVKTAVAKWIDTLRGDRVGLILFSGDAFMQIPLTNDLTTVQTLLEAAGPQVIRSGGSNIGVAIETAIAVYERDKGASRAVVIFSDGENHEGDPVAMARTAWNQHKVRVFTVGVGTTEGAKVPQRYDWRKGEPIGEIRNDYGASVRSRINPVALRAIASAGGGAYLSLADDPEAMTELQTLHLSKLAKEARAIDADDYDDWFQVPLFLALVLFWLEPILQNLKKLGAARALKASKGSTTPGKTMTKPVPTKKQAPAPPKPSYSTAGGTASTLLALLLAGLAASAGTPRASAAAGDEARLQVRYTQQQIARGETDKALDDLSTRYDAQPDSALAMYNYGVGLYAAGKHAEAAAVFEQVANLPGDTGLREKALFQLANATVRRGEDMLAKRDIAGGTQEMERSLGIYDELVKEDKRARKNLEVTQELYLELLEKIADQNLKSAKDNPSDKARRVALEKAIGALEKMVEREPEHKTAKPKLDQAKKDLAKEFVDEGKEERADAEKVFAGKKPSDAKRPMEKALEHGNKAQELDPDSKEAKDFLADTQKRYSEMLTSQGQKQLDDAMKENKPQPKLAQLEKASATAQQAVEMDAENKKAQDLLAKTMAEAEKTNVEEGDKNAQSAERAKNALQEATALNQAVNNYQAALDINEKNERALEQMEKLTPKLAEALEQMGMDELAAAKASEGMEQMQQMAQNGQQPPPPGQTPPNMGEMRETLDHLSKADQALAQAESYGAPPEGIQPARQEISQLTDQLQNQMNALDQQQQQQNGKQQQGEGTQEQQTAQNSPQSPQQGEQSGPPPLERMSTEKSFADIRDIQSGAEMKKALKDW